MKICRHWWAMARLTAQACNNLGGWPARSPFLLTKMHQGSFFQSTKARAHPALLQLAASVGGFSKLAPLIGQHQVQLYAWIRGKRLPKVFPRKATNYLFAQTGLTADQLFRSYATQIQPGVWKMPQGAAFVPESAIHFGCDLPKLLATLNERERRVILLRLQGATFEEIAAEIGVTRERIRQNEVMARKKLRWRCAKLGYKR